MDKKFFRGCYIPNYKSKRQELLEKLEMLEIYIWLMENDNE